jgi:thioredoxin-like negative regulator of GroEL
MSNFFVLRRMVKNSKTVDVRSRKDVASLENIIKGGPITIVLIYADWCGHCTRFKENVWSKLLENSHNAKLASIHHDQLENTSLKDAKIKGYPSVLVVGKDGKPAVFKGPAGEEEPTNAMPNADLETLEKIVDADAETILREEAEDPTASMMTPPDAREDIVSARQEAAVNRQMGGGNLFKLLKKAASPPTHKKGGKTKKRRHSKRHTRRITS